MHAPGTPQPTPPAHLPLYTAQQILEAAGCGDCASEVRFYPVPIRLPHEAIQLFGLYIAHDDTCPALNAMARRQQQGDQT